LVACRLDAATLRDAVRASEGPSFSEGVNVSKHSCVCGHEFESHCNGACVQGCYECSCAAFVAAPNSTKEAATPISSELTADYEKWHKALSPDDVLDIYVPGRLRCPTCDFQVSKATIFLGSGEIGASKAEVYQQSEPCPNDGHPMVRVTWREEADANRKYAEKLISEIMVATDASSLPEALEKAKAGRDTGPAAEPGTSLTTAWERFAEEEGHTQPDRRFEHYEPGRRAFWAGAQSLVGVVADALEDENDVDSWQKLEGAYEEIGQACEEMKL
jgi:hypothetical protein